MDTKVIPRFQTYAFKKLIFFWPKLQFSFLTIAPVYFSKVET